MVRSGQNSPPALVVRYRQELDGIDKSANNPHDMIEHMLAGSLTGDPAGIFFIP